MLKTVRCATAADFKLAWTVLWIAILLAGCATGQKAFYRGQYDKAVLQSVERLRKKPGHEEATATLRQAYPSALTFHNQNIARFARSKDPLRWENIAAEYQALNRLAGEIQRSPAAQNVVGSVDFFESEWSQARESAGAARFELGTRALAAATRESASEALQHFKRGQAWSPSSRDWQTLMLQAQSAATLRVLVTPLVNTPQNLDPQGFDQRLLQTLRNLRTGDLIVFVPWNPNLPPDAAVADHTLQLGFERLEPGREHLKEKEQTFPNKTTSTRFTKTVTSEATLNFRILAADGSALVQERFSASHLWEHEWATVQGDIDSVPQDIRALLKNREIPPPPAQELFQDLSEDLITKIAQRTDRFYRRYR